jgi:hypothetical protein
MMEHFPDEATLLEMQPEALGPFVLRYLMGPGGPGIDTRRPHISQYAPACRNNRNWLAVANGFQRNEREAETHHDMARACSKDLAVLVEASLAAWFSSARRPFPPRGQPRRLQGPRRHFVAIWDGRAAYPASITLTDAREHGFNRVLGVFEQSRTGWPRKMFVWSRVDAWDLRRIYLAHSRGPAGAR